MKAAHIIDFEKTNDGLQTHLITLENDNGMKVALLDFGASVYSLCVPDKKGKLRDVVLGYGHIGGYETGGTYFGASVGRCCNRIAKGRFSLNGTDHQLSVNDGENHLHGGEDSFSRRIWSYEADDTSVCFTIKSADGEEGYPGNLEAQAYFALDEENRLTIRYSAQSDKDTICNMTNHMYFNLDGYGAGDCQNQFLRIYADAYTPKDESGIPTGEIVPVEGTEFDFREGKTIGYGLRQMQADERKMEGFDHNYVLDHPDLEHVAVRAWSQGSGIGLECRTTQKGIQLYTANATDVPEGEGKDGSGFGTWSGFCLETQNFPDAVNHDNFPSPVLKAGETYSHTTIFQFLQ